MSNILKEIWYQASTFQGWGERQDLDFKIDRNEL